MLALISVVRRCLLGRLTVALPSLSNTFVMTETNDKEEQMTQETNERIEKWLAKSGVEELRTLCGNCDHPISMNYHFQEWAHTPNGKRLCRDADTIAWPVPLEAS